MSKVLKICYNELKSVEVEDGYIVDNYLTKEDNMGYSVVRTHLNGKHPYMKNISSNRTYYLINGSAIFYFEDQRITLKDGEMLVIPKNTKYAFKGKFDAILIDHPAFDSKDDIIYEENIKEEE